MATVDTANTSLTEGLARIFSGYSLKEPAYKTMTAAEFREAKKTAVSADDVARKVNKALVEAVVAKHRNRHNKKK